MGDDATDEARCVRKERPQALSVAPGVLEAMAEARVAASRVYFIGCEESDGHHGPVKIGWTTTPAEERLCALQTGVPYNLVLLHTIVGNSTTEKELHARFGYYRLRGEWFRPCVQLLWYIAKRKLAAVGEEKSVYAAKAFSIVSAADKSDPASLWQAIRNLDFDIARRIV